MKIKRLIIIVAVLVALSVTTALAYGDDIRQFVFGRSSIAQVESIDDRTKITNETASMGVGIRNSSFFNAEQYIGKSSFSTIDELRQAASFDVREPLFLPGNTVLNNVAGSRFTEEEHIYAAMFDYSIRHTPSYVQKGDVYVLENFSEVFSGFSGFSLSQCFVGHDAYLEIDTLYTFEKVMIGDCEASVVFQSDDNTEITSLYWQKNGVVYILHSYGASLDLDTMTAIAESV